MLNYLKSFKLFEEETEVWYYKPSLGILEKLNELFYLYDKNYKKLKSEILDLTYSEDSDGGENILMTIKYKNMKYRLNINKFYLKGRGNIINGHYIEISNDNGIYIFKINQDEEIKEIRYGKIELLLDVNFLLNISKDIKYFNSEVNLNVEIDPWGEEDWGEDYWDYIGNDYENN